MTAKLMLRIAAGISLLFTLGHSLGGLKLWSPIGSNAVLQAMKDVPFRTMGVNRTYLDFYRGFGWSLSVAMLLQTVLLWQLASLARADAASVRPLIAAFIAATLAGAVISWRFLFPIPALFSLALLIPLVWAYLLAR
jgi:hypothetical protein